MKSIFFFEAMIPYSVKAPKRQSSSGVDRKPVRPAILRRTPPFLHASEKESKFNFETVRFTDLPSRIREIP